MYATHKYNPCYGKNFTKNNNKKTSKQKVHKQKTTLLYSNYYYMHMNFV